MKIRRSKNISLDNDIKLFLQNAIIKLKNMNFKNIKISAQSDSNIEYLGEEVSELIFLERLPYVGEFANTIKNVPKKNKSDYIIGFIGGTRKEKGILELIEYLDKNNLPDNIKFIIQLNSERLYSISRAHYDRLIDLSKNSINLQLIDKYLEKDDYYSLFSKIDAVILPYDHGYIGRGSGILDEAIYFNKDIYLKTNSNWSQKLGTNKNIHFFDFSNLEQEILKVFNTKKYV